MNRKYPICVDLDGTLTPCDTLWEACLQLALRYPFRFLHALLSLRRSRACFKAKIAELQPLDPNTLSWNSELVAWLRMKKSAGHSLILVTAAHQTYAEAVALKFDIFDEVHGSGNEINLKARKKAELLEARFGKRGFIYVGNSRDDLPVWNAAESAVVVNAPVSVEKEVRKTGRMLKALHGPGKGVRVWLKELRVHQWAKNVLVFIPLLAAHQFHDIVVLQNAFLAFLSFCLCASSVYLLNDLVDLGPDRQHPRKKSRPLAEGSIPISQGLAAVPLLLGVSFWIAASINIRFVSVLAGYYLLTLAYSFWLKSIPLIDVLILAGLYLIRVVAGGIATGLPVSLWLHAFAIFIFFSLGLMKRYIELREIQKLELTKTVGRGYLTDDIEIVSTMGVASGYIAVLILILYVGSAEVKQFYRQPVILMGANLLVLYWISRAWLLAHRNQLHDDPVVFAISDLTSRIVGLKLILIFILATFLPA
jgi:4-hydroxybenzoate polyprenyltransferase/phosphoserine phosphatase